MQQPLKIVMPETLFTDAQHSEAQDFFERVLGMRAQEVLFGDDTLLSDFSFSGEFPEVDALLQGASKDSDLQALHQAWDNAVLKKLKAVYGLELLNTRISLPALFEMIRVSKAPSRLH